MVPGDPKGQCTAVEGPGPALCVYLQGLFARSVLSAQKPAGVLWGHFLWQNWLRRRIPVFGLFRVLASDCRAWKALQG